MVNFALIYSYDDWREKDDHSASLEDSQLSSDERYESESQQYTGSYATNYAEHRRSVAATQEIYSRRPERIVSPTHDNHCEIGECVESSMRSDDESYAEDEEGYYYYN